jgi:two-component system, OmpR family, alkaline phosphatase synthesis response regulator PhoP
MPKKRRLSPRSKKILIIDDEAEILLLAASRLEANGYAVVTALSGKQGLETAKKEMPALVLLDYVMPEMNGGEVLDRLKRDPRTKRIPVIMFTADVKKVKVGEFQMRGAVGCLFKPFSQRQFLSKVKEALDQ